MLYISDATLAGVKAGRLIVEGSVVRMAATGRIVEHLVEIDKIPTTPLTHTARQALAEAKTPKGAVIALGSVAVGVAAVEVATRPLRHAKKLEQRLNQALVDYFEAAQQGRLTPQQIQNTIDAIVAVENHPRRGHLPTLTQLSITHFANDITRYTRQLTHAPVPPGSRHQVTDLPALRRQLEVQRDLPRTTTPMPPATNPPQHGKLSPTGTGTGTTTAHPPGSAATQGIGEQWQRSAS